MSIKATLLLAFVAIAACQSFNYSEDLSQDLANFSLISYCGEAKIRQWSCGPSCQQFPEGLSDMQLISNSAKNAFGYLGFSKQHGAIIVAFRGTIPWSLTNWVTDIDTQKTSYPLCENCQVHQGFYKQFDLLKGQLKDAFLTLRQKYSSAKLFVTGHSLGAAISTLSIPLIYELNGNKPIDAFYNFGSPRVGCSKFANWFNTQNFALEHARITNGADPVPHLPPSVFPFKFEHHSHEVFYNSFLLFGFKQNQCDAGESTFCANSVTVAANPVDHGTYFKWDWLKTIVTCQ
ncbi:lipase family protein (macronuclear) [Tetrahymena thermophila SB210]|uniref:Lipase family protein n=1 Tax=Tetrahymena thermophila (strain SB210) TaxID=312017 RepID=Q24BP5_TETTS|nr:lipase family protein [Tetrahymena thermophila SB210]EAS05198.1 lipase family protein [Tetrahymena thermophila SB210]|eukprot:XP_001025443.1 lipase family protein [Tetrahymena thermophila SB210]